MIDQVTQETRHLVALNADIVGFSRLVADDPRRTASVVEEYRVLVEDRVRENNGTLVNFVGDSFMAVFKETIDAIQASIAIQDAVGDHNSTLGPNHRVEFRMGLDQGEVARKGDEYFGDPLNIAARIQARAVPGGISVSGRVYRALDEPRLRFRNTGAHRLKNIPEPVEIFEFSPVPGGKLSRDRGQFTLQLPTLIILPIIGDNLSTQVSSAAQVFRSDLVHRLSLLPHVRIIESITADAFEGSPAHYIVETGILEVGDNVRIYAKLTEVATLNVVTSLKWATTVDGLFEMIDEMTEDVERRVGVELIVGERAVLYEAIDNPEVVRKMFQGWYHLMVPNRADWIKATELIDEVVAEFPDYIYGGVMQAFGNWLGAAHGFATDPESLLDLAFGQAQRMSQMGDPTGMASMIQAAIYLERGQPEQALATIEDVQITRPTCDLTFALEGSIRRYLGQWEKSLDLIDTAIELAAVTPPWYPTVQACSLFMGQRLDRAGSVSEEVIEHYPDSLEALLILAAVQEEMGLERRARATVGAIRDRFPALDFDAWLKSHPYRDKGVVDRWRHDLVAAGLIEENV